MFSTTPVLSVTPSQRDAALLPGNRLPIELLQKIILLTTTPTDEHTTLHLSQVSRIWCIAIIGLTYLFTEADWNRWPAGLVELWCERAGARPLTIRLNTYDGPPYNGINWTKDAIARFSHRCNVVQLKTLTLNHKVLREVVTILLTAQAPALQQLGVFSNAVSINTFDIYIDSDKMPNLCVLRTQGVIPHISKPLAGMTEMEYYVSGLKWWDGLTTALTKLPNLRHLCLRFPQGDCYGFREDLHIALPSLEILELRAIRCEALSNVRIFFASAELPKLRLISLVKIEGECACRDTIELLGPYVPELRQLSLFGYSNLHLFSPVLQALNDSPILPQLEEVRLLCNMDYKIPDSSYPDDLRTLVQSRKGKLRCLYIPAFENGGLMDFLNNNLSHLELHSPYQPSLFLLPKYYEGLS